ncbi:MAG: RagB/SusD family nutrient uptake outer membrane protein [Coprobacter sp.]|nr:RagB/SusD family nutrient uptake outer membrane protein [Coprobacter sp.]
MNIKKYIIYGVIAILPFTSSSCLFDDAPVDKITDNYIWETPMLLDEYVLPWYRNMNNGFSTFVPTSIALVKSSSRYYMPWFADQIVPSKTDYYNAGYGDLLKGNNQEITNWATVKWANYYTQIQAINRLFENEEKIAAGEQKERILGEAHFFRAYYYYMLWRHWGGVMLINKTFDPLKENTKFARASYSEMVTAIVNDAKEAANRLPVYYASTDAGRITKGAALMLIAKTYMWASSEYYQNKSNDYLGFTDDQSQAMLEKAKKAYEDLFELNQYSLVQIAGTSVEDIKKEYRNIFLTKNSQESILEVQHSNDGNYDTGYGHKLDRDAASPFFTGTIAAYTPTQNHVDEYGMRDGYVYDSNNPYEGRDYRFYANILYDGSVYNGHTMDIHYVRTGNTEVAGEDLTQYGESETAAYSRTGYYMGKFVDETQKIDKDETYASKQNYIIWRYAEALLDYAEVMFRLGDNGTALAKVNEVRSRVKMHTLPSLTWEELVNERRIELAFEETTYWDMFRWGVAVEKMNGETNPIKAMKIVVNSANGQTRYTISNMNRFPKRVRYFEEKQYYLPIPWDEIRYHGVAQNPEWREM